MSREQLFCSKCGKLNWSQWGETCECKEPDYRFESYDDYLAHEKEKRLTKDRDWQEDMELLNQCGDSYMPYKETEFSVMLPYWLQQYAEVKEERDELESLAENLNADVGQLEKELAAEKARADQAEAKAGFWEMEYYALHREYNEYRTIYPPAVLEEGETK